MTDSEALTEARVREILAGCEGVTPGPWTAELLQEGIAEPEMTALVRSSDPLKLIVAQTKPGAVEGRYALTADYIARLDPDTVRSLCTLALSALGTAPAVGVTPFAWISEYAYQAILGGRLIDAVLRPTEEPGFRHPLYASPVSATAAEIRAKDLTELASELREDYATVRKWSGSALVANELSKTDTRAGLADLYSDLCRLGNSLDYYADRLTALSEATANGK